jgi:hypothetical protein
MGAREPNQCNSSDQRRHFQAIVACMVHYCFKHCCVLLIDCIPIVSLVIFIGVVSLHCFVSSSLLLFYCIQCIVSLLLLDLLFLLQIHKSVAHYYNIVSQEILRWMLLPLASRRSGGGVQAPETTAGRWAGLKAAAMLLHQGHRGRGCYWGHRTND